MARSLQRTRGGKKEIQLFLKGSNKARARERENRRTVTFEILMSFEK